MPEHPTDRAVREPGTPTTPDPGEIRRLAHDLNNLMTAIQGYAEILLEDIEPSSPHRGDIELLHKATRRASAIVGDLMALGRSGAPSESPAARRDG